jgi:hypothetical protein
VVPYNKRLALAVTQVNNAGEFIGRRNKRNSFMNDKRTLDNLPEEYDVNSIIERTLLKDKVLDSTITIPQAL